MDGFANSSKPAHIENFLAAHGYDVKLLNTMFLSRLSDNGYKRFLPAIRPSLFLLYCLELISYTQGRFLAFSRKNTYYYLVVSRMRLRRKIVGPLLKGYDHIICESPMDSLVFLDDMKETNTIYDCATPMADELYYGNELTKKQHSKFKTSEIKVYESVNHLSFHWQCYADYVKKYYKDTGNIFIFNGGTDEPAAKAQYSSKPKIVYLGHLGGYWTNLPLLSKLSKTCDIDVYGSPAPPKELGLNYKGYAKPTVLADYQFGLITLSKDRLRREGFSAKHVEYLSYGLPVLIPDWRTSTKNMGGTVHYTPDTFSELIAKYSDEREWARTSQAALIQAAEYEWETVLNPLLGMLEDRTNRSANEDI